MIFVATALQIRSTTFQQTYDGEVNGVELDKKIKMVFVTKYLLNVSKANMFFLCRCFFYTIEKWKGTG
jgi:hypothetical protein